MIDEAIVAAHLPNRDVVLPMEHEHLPPGDPSLHIVLTPIIPTLSPFQTCP